MKRPAYQIEPRPIRECMWQPSSATVDQVMEKIHTMRRMEATTYLRRDYLYSPDSPYYCTTATTPSSSSSSRRRLSKQQQQQQQHPYMNETTRQNMIDLLYEIGDYCHFRRETVSYAIWNLMDRYLSLKTHTPLSSKSDFQLIACTSLYIAVKLLEPVSMDVQSLADLSRGAFDSQTILEMERHMIFALDWRISHGPTPIGFVQLYLTLLQLDGAVLSHANLWNVLWEQAQYQIELAVVDYDLTVSQNPSDVALAAVWNALECGHLESSLVKSWQNQLMFHLGLCHEDDRLQNLPNLQLALCKLQYMSTSSSSSSEQEEESAAAAAAAAAALATAAQQEQAPLLVSSDDDDDDDVIDLDGNQAATESALLLIDETETGEEDSPARRYSLFPSPVSVMETNELFPQHYYNTTTTTDNNSDEFATPIKEEGEEEEQHEVFDDEEINGGVENERIILKPLKNQMKKIGSTCSYYGQNFWRNITSSSSSSSSSSSASPASLSPASA